MTGAGLEVAALWICLFGPSVALAAHAGLLVDRVEATRLLVAVSAAGAVVALAAGFVAGSSAAGAAGADRAARRGIRDLPAGRVRARPALAGGDRTQEANGHVETARYVGFGLGPLVGGIAFAAGGLGLAMAIDALTFVLVAAAAARLRVRRAAGPGTADAPSAAREGSRCCSATASCAS